MVIRDIANSMEYANSKNFICAIYAIRTYAAILPSRENVPNEVYKSRGTPLLVGQVQDPFRSMVTMIYRSRTR